ncbi:MAG TPA: AEC family transporter [Xanthobacteraceae bacterium]
MNQILGIAELILPLFGVIALGYVAASTGLLKERTAEGVSDYVYTVAIPLMIFRTLAEAKLPETLPWSYWIAYFAGAFGAWFACQSAAALVFGRPAREAIVYGFTAGQSNIVLVGIPLVLSTFGEPGAVPLFLLVAVNLPLMMTIATLLIEGSGAGISREALMRLIRSFATNLVLIGFVAGLLARFVGFAPAGPLKGVVDLVAASAVPCALFAMGLSLRHYGIAGDIRTTSVIVALKLVAHPLIVFLLVRHVLELPPVFAGVAVVFASMPCGINSYLLAERYRAGVPATAGAVSLSTTVAIVSISFWLWMVGVGGG